MSSDPIGRPIEILLVEDSLDDAHLTFEAFKTGDVPHRLTWLRDGQDAMEFLVRRGRFARAPRPDLILLDLGLPGKDGREVLTEIKTDEDLREIPVVIMTASKAHEDIVRSELLQVESYVTKPVDMDKFLSIIRELKQYLHADLMLPFAD